jgi:hypothetical protein
MHDPPPAAAPVSTQGPSEAGKLGHATAPGCGWLHACCPPPAKYLAAPAWQQASRVGIAATLCLGSGMGAYQALQASDPQLGSNLLDALQWGAITCIAIAAPALGRVTSTGVERIFGTLIGGSVAILVAIPATLPLYVSICFLLVTAGALAGSWYGLDYRCGGAGCSLAAALQGLMRIGQRAGVRMGGGAPPRHARPW